MSKRVMTLLLAMVMVLTMFPMTVAAGNIEKFNDVSKDKWYYTWVDNVVEKGYFAGTSETTFDPNTAMTRGMFVTVLANMEGVKIDNGVSAFSDVDAGKWYAGAAKWASDNKIVSGYPDGTFRPFEEVTREQMCVIMDSYIKYYSEKNDVSHEIKPATVEFTDVKDISTWAEKAVMQCKEYGLVEGYPIDGTFRPKNGSTRAEVSAVVSKLAWLVEEIKGGSSVRPSSPSEPENYTYVLSVMVDEIDLLGKTSAPLNGSVEYTMDQSISEVTKNFLEANKAVYEEAFNQALDIAKEKGFVNADGEISVIECSIEGIYREIDPLEIMDEQFEARKEFIKERVDVSTWATIETLMNRFKPSEALVESGTRKIITAEEYYNLVVDQQADLETLSKNWKPNEAFYSDPIYMVNGSVSKNRVIEAAVNRGENFVLGFTEVDANSIPNVDKYLIAFFGDEAEETGKGFEMEMKEFIETIVPGEHYVDLEKTPEENDDAIGISSIGKITISIDDLSTDNETVNKVLEFIQERYAGETVEGKLVIDWDFIAR